MSRASYVLSTISKNVGIVIAPPMASTFLKHIEFVDLGEGKLLVIFVSKSGLLQRKLIRVADRLHAGRIEQGGQLSGRTVCRAHSDGHSQRSGENDAGRADVVRSHAGAASGVEQHAGVGSGTRMRFTFKARRTFSTSRSLPMSSACGTFPDVRGEGPACEDPE